MSAPRLSNSFAEMRECLSYDPDTGAFEWAKNRGNVKAGTKAGTKTDARGYLVINFGGRRHYAHRLAWFFAHGEMPTGDIDHINRDPSDNRISNLRLATRSQNLANKKAAGGSSEFKGVSYHCQRQRWRATIKDVHLGLFDTEEEAARAYDNAALNLYGEFAGLNFAGAV